MDRSGSINAAGGFLRALKERGPGGQDAGAGGTHLPTSEILLFLLEHGEQPVQLLARETRIELPILLDALRNLRDLKLVDVRAGGAGDIVLLTETGEVVARRQREQ